jgi:hypothetical protein
MRAFIALAWLPLIYAQRDGAVGPNKENLDAEQAPMAGNAPGPQKSAPDVMAVYGNRDYGKSNPALGKSEYDRVCPRLDGEVADLGDGLFVRYQCDTHAATWDEYNWTAGLHSLEQCARLCSNQPYCKSSIWEKSDATCWLSDSSTPSGRTTYGYVHMIPVSNYPSKSCKIEKAGLESRISECNKRVEELERQVERGGVQCPDYNKEIFNDKGSKYTIYCSKGELLAPSIHITF